jgi:hypothetical protein
MDRWMREGGCCRYLRPSWRFRGLFWWRDRIFTYPRMAQIAFDILSIPAMSSECEQVFSQTKLLITTQRNRLADEIIEAVELLKHWYKTGQFKTVKACTQACRRYSHR